MSIKQPESQHLPQISPEIVEITDESKRTFVQSIERYLKQKSIVRRATPPTTQDVLDGLHRTALEDDQKKMNSIIQRG